MKKCWKWLRELKPYEIPSTLHVCGDTTKILDRMGQSHAQSLELDYKVDLLTARKRLPKDVTIIGNLDPVGTLLNASPEEVTASVKTLLDISPLLEQYILSTGCTVAPETPPENIHAMVEAAREFG